MCTECPLCPFNEIYLPFQGSVTLLTKNHQQNWDLRNELSVQQVVEMRAGVFRVFQIKIKWQQMKRNTEFTWELLLKRQLLWCCGDVSLIWPIFQYCQFSKPTKFSQIYCSYFTVVNGNVLQLNQPARNKSVLHQRRYTAAIKHEIFWRW